MTDDEQKMLDECLKAEAGLTPWEIDFIDDLDGLQRTQMLSPKQHDKLKQIAEKL